MLDHVYIIFSHVIYAIKFFINKTAIHLACENECIDIIKLLLNHPCIDVNAFMEILSLIYYIFFNCLHCFII